MTATSMSSTSQSVHLFSGTPYARSRFWTTYPTGFSSATEAAHAPAADGGRPALLRGVLFRRGDDALIEVDVLRDDQVRAVAADRRSARAPPHLAPRPFVREQARRVLAHLLHVADLGEAARDAVVHDLRDAADARGDDGHLAGQGLERREPERLLLRRQE